MQLAVKYFFLFHVLGYETTEPYRAPDESNQSGDRDGFRGGRGRGGFRGRGGGPRGGNRGNYSGGNYSGGNYGGGNYGAGFARGGGQNQVRDISCSTCLMYEATCFFLGATPIFFVCLITDFVDQF